MRLWSIHPKYLDRAGLLALWRESLLAQKVLQGNTRGYRNHPQLARFRTHPRPQEAMATYLIGIWQESQRRGYRFDRLKIAGRPSQRTIPITLGQLEHELDLLRHKLRRRDPRQFTKICDIEEIEPHSLFTVIAGPVEPWERTKSF